MINRFLRVIDGADCQGDSFVKLGFARACCHLLADRNHQVCLTDASIGSAHRTAEYANLHGQGQGVRIYGKYLDEPYMHS